VGQADMVSRDPAAPKLGDVVDDVTPGGPGGDASAVWRRAPQAAYVESPGRAVVLDLAHLDRPPYVFEGSAAEIWGCLDEGWTQADVANHLAEAFEAPVEVVAADVGQFVDRLRELGLVVAGDAV
jgi:hypothetical protein